MCNIYIVEYYLEYRRKTYIENFAIFKGVIETKLVWLENDIIFAIIHLVRKQKFLKN